MYGVDVGGGLGEVLGGAGVMVISGLARGIDGAAQAGALREGGTTLAVLGCGVDVVYPRSTVIYMEAMLTQGAVVSEVPMGVPPAPQRFTLLRLIRGLAQAVVVVEGRMGRDLRSAQAERAAGGRVPAGTAPALGEHEARVLEALDDEFRHVEKVIERAGLDAGPALAAPVTLEMRGLVRRGAGQRFARRSAFGPLESGGDTWPSHPLS